MALRELNESDAPSNRADSSPPLFSVIFSCIGKREKEAGEDFFRISATQSMFLDIDPVLNWIPLKSRCNSKCSYSSSKNVVRQK
jgi:hypothetical protein